MEWRSYILPVLLSATVAGVGTHYTGISQLKAQMSEIRVAMAEAQAQYVTEDDLESQESYARDKRLLDKGLQDIDTLSQVVHGNQQQISRMIAIGESNGERIQRLENRLMRAHGE